MLVSKNWKKALQKFKSHEASHTDTEAKVKWIARDLPTVASQLSTKSQQLQQICREGLLMQLKALRFLARQGIAIRGDNETEGNLQQHGVKVTVIYKVG